MILFDLIYNLAILVAISVLSGFLDERFSRDTLNGKILQGLLFGFAAMVGMLQPFVLTEGVIFDGRSVIISICAFFFGPFAGIIAAIISIVTRFFIGGAGIITGMLVIVTSLVIGLAFHIYSKDKSTAPSSSTLLALGLLVHINMLIWMFFLPSNIIWETFRTMTFSVLIFFPLATILIGKILGDQLSNSVLIQSLKDGEAKFKAIFNSTNEAIFIHDAETSRIIALNDRSLELYGINSKEAFLNAKNKSISSNDSIYNDRTAKEYVKKAISEGPQTFDWLARKYNDELFWVEVSLSFANIGNKGVVIAVVRDINDRRIHEDKLASSLHEKEILLAEIHHRVKNNLAIISSLISLQIELVQDPEAIHMLKSTDNRIKSIALVHELVYNNDDFSTIDFGSFLRELVPILDAFNNTENCNIDVEVSAKSPILDLNTSIPAALIVNELITNAFKHSFKGRSEGRIEVVFEEKNDLYTLTVKDNGSGVSDIKKLTSGDSMGFTIIQGLVGQLQGSIDFDNNGVGLKVVVKFAKAKVDQYH